MREQLEPLLLITAVGSAVAIGAKRIGVPYNVALVLVGLLLVLFDLLPTVPMNPEVILVVFLPLLVFEGALFTDADGLRKAARPILALALPGVALSLLGTAAVAMWILSLPFAASLLLGALLAITDTVSVLLAFRSVRVPHRLAAIMEGESLFNDGTALVLVSLTTGVLASGHFSALDAGREFFIAIFGGVALGAGFGALGGAVLRYTPDHLTAILVSIVMVFTTALIAENAHASPVIAVVIVGVLAGRAARRALEPSRVLALQGFWETAGFTLNVLIFLLVGLQLKADMLLREAPYIALALLALHAGRAVAVYGCFAILRAVTREIVPSNWQHTMVVGNVKGALSMAAVLALPATLPYRDRLVSIVFGVTFVTLVSQALPFARLLKLLRVTSDAKHADVDAARAILVGARRGQAAVDELLQTGLLSRKSHAERHAAFQRQIISAESVLRVAESQHGSEHTTDVVILNAQKAAILDFSRRGLIPLETAERQISEIDRMLIRTQEQE